MTAYHGGKQRIGLDLAKVIYNVCIEIEQNTNFKIKGYCEPFCGMLGVYQHIPSLFSSHNKMKYKAGDINESVVLMWKDVKKGWTPPTKSITKDKYKSIMSSKNSALKAFVGCTQSFRGVFNGSYFPQTDSRIKTNSDRVQSLRINIQNISFSHTNYTSYSKLKNHVIYCDPPYMNTQKRYIQEFDSDEFWSWCKYMSRNNIVFVSEYTAPKSIRKIWSFGKENMYIVMS